MNNNPSHESIALDHVEAVKAASLGIRTTHEAAERADAMPDRRRLGELNALLGRSLKLAEVHATLAVAEAIREQTEALKPKPVESRVVFSSDAESGRAIARDLAAYHAAGGCPPCPDDGMGPQLTFEDATTADVTP